MLYDNPQATREESDKDSTFRNTNSKMNVDEEIKWHSLVKNTPTGNNLPNSNLTAKKVKTLVTEYLEDTVELLQKHFGSFLVDTSCQLLKQKISLQDKVKRADHLLHIDPGGPVEKFPKSTYTSNILTVSKRIMEQLFSGNVWNRSSNANTNKENNYFETSLKLLA